MTTKELAEIRMQCLHMAGNRTQHASMEEYLATAQRLYQFVTGPTPKPQRAVRGTGKGSRGSRR